jgi:hypothetical protein
LSEQIFRIDKWSFSISNARCAASPCATIRAARSATSIAFSVATESS